MANDVEIKVTADTSNAQAGITKVKTGFQGMKDSIVKNRKAIGLGITALGVGIEGLAKSQQGLTESSRKLANATGMSEQEIRGMATSLSNATFPLDSALELMTLGAQQGLDSADALKQYAAFWDTVGDATGLSAEALAKSGAALAAVGIEVGNESELLGAFGLITQESTSTVQEFLDGISKLAPEMSAMGLSVDEAAVIMTTMERELGLTARTARTEFKEALEQSETGLAGVLEQLGLSESQLATYRTKLEESTGVIQDNADAHASTKTVMDKLKSSMSDLMFANGALIEKASMLAPLFLAAGPIIAGFSVIMGAMSGVANIAKFAMLGLNLSMGPILLGVVALAAAIAIGILIWKNFDVIVAALKKTFEKITEVYKSKLGWLLPAGPLIKGILYLKDNWEEIWGKIKSTFQNIGEKIKSLYNSKLGWLLPAGPLVKAILFLKDNWKEIWDSIKATFDTVSGALIGAFRSVKGTILGIWDGLVSGIKDGINTVIGAINGFIRGINNIKITVPSFSAPKWLGGMRWGGFSVGMPQIPEIPTLAQGGIVRSPTLAMLGESGPEAVVPLGRSGAGMTVNLVINGDINGMDDFEQKVTSVIRDAVLGGGFSGVLARA
jgi:predicted nucleic acid-binding protein